MTHQQQTQQLMTQTACRRWFLGQCGVGLAGIAAKGLFASENRPVTAPNPLAARQPHFPGKVKRVIYMFQAGAPSHLELFDPKPQLSKRDGQLPPAELLKDYRAAFINPNSALLGPKYRFAPHGECGMQLSELLPHTAAMADEICLIRSMQTESVNHAPGQIFMNTGSESLAAPALELGHCTAWEVKRRSCPVLSC